MTAQHHLQLHPLRPEDIPSTEDDAFATFLDANFELGEKLMQTMGDWSKGPLKCDNTVQIMNLTSSCGSTRKALDIKDYWCGRQSLHTAETVRSFSRPKPEGGPMHAVRSFSRRLSHKPEVPNETAANESALETAQPTEVERQAQVMSQVPHGLYERFRRGLLEYHSENEREYIEACRETQCLQVYQPHVAEVWRLTYVTPAPTNPRTFVVLLLSRELKNEPVGERCFMNISIPFLHPDCPEKTGAEKSRVRGKYVSVERVTEMKGGAEVEWKMATSSDAGGNIPRFMTNSSLPNSIAEDVPSFLKWMVKRFPEGGEVDSQAAPES